MMRQTTNVFITVCLGSVIAVPVQLSEDESRSSPSPKKVLSDSVHSISDNVFVSLTRSEPPSSNIIISPVSIHFALSLLYHGAGGATKKQLSQFMKFDDLNEDNLKSAAQGLLRSYGTKRTELNETIELANALFADEKLEINRDFEETLETFLFSGVKNVDFSSPEEAAQRINNWVENRTHNLITDFLSADALSDESRLMLLNAIYFKADWKNNFDQAESYQGSFNIGQNMKRRVDMISQENSFKYTNNHEKLDSQIVSIPYQDESFSMLLFLPNQEGPEAIYNLSENLSQMDFNSLLREMEANSLRLSLPKFKLGYKTELKSTLRQQGLENIFESADFSGISDERLEVSDVVHETRIEVNEEGSEAAGVTGILLDLRGGLTETPEMTLNRPFIFVIQDQENNIPLFIGKIASPNEALGEEEVANAESLISNRSNLPIQSPEDIAYLRNNPEASLHLDERECLEQVEDYVNTNKVMFPCPPYDTQPIEEHKQKFGDGSRFGVNGEQAALAHI